MDPTDFRATRSVARPTARALSTLASTALSVLTAWTLTGAAPSAADDRFADPSGGITSSPGCDQVAGSFVVTLDGDRRDSRPVDDIAQELVERWGGTVGYVYAHALEGFQLEATKRQADALLQEPTVARVEPDCWGGVGAAGGTTQQFDAPWGLDRIDRRPLVLLDGIYEFGSTGAGIHTYILDSGVRANHPDLAGRVLPGHSVLGGGTGDCLGHGTHVAGIVGGTTFGVAKGVWLHPVVVVNCSGVGTASQALAGVDWVTAHRVDPAVVNMSVRYGGSASLDDGVRNSIASGVHFAVGAGNESTSACSFSPGRVAEAVTVGATDDTDTVAGFSNQGTCTDLFAPGVDVPSACPADLTAFCLQSCVPMGGGVSYCSGTSMASPHAAGLLARYVGENPSHTPAQSFQAVVGLATDGALFGVDDAPNRMLYSGFLENAPPIPVEDWYITVWEKPITLQVADLLANDKDTDSDPLTVCGLIQPAYGTATMNGPDEIVYQPPPGCGVNYDPFQYIVCDGVDSAAGTVQMEIGGIVCPQSS